MWSQDTGQGSHKGKGNAKHSIIRSLYVAHDINQVSGNGSMLHVRRLDLHHKNYASCHLGETAARQPFCAHTAEVLQ